MASWMVHLRIADAFLDKLENIDETAFVMGNIAPDSGVPNEDWTVYRPGKKESHFKTKPEDETFFDVDQFCKEYFNEELIRTYDRRQYSFFLGYYVHLLTDIRWTKTIYVSLITSYSKECAEDKNKLIWTAKGDWYDLDFRYLRDHPDFRAFSVYENAVDFENVFMDMFAEDAFENRRKYICGFYRSDKHGDLDREYQYLTPEEVEMFVEETVSWIQKQSMISLTDRYRWQSI